MSRTTVSGHFIEGAKGPIFVLVRRPVAQPFGCVLVVPPFAEEMNKCRRMVTEVALGLAERGIATVVPDLYGTGDSGGDFLDADWDTWLGDVGRASAWVAESVGRVTGVLAIRLGCALSVQAALDGYLPSVSRSVFWQPVFDGRRHLTQFLRLRLAASLMADRKETMKDLQQLLELEGELEVAGYRLSPRLVRQLEAITCPAELPVSLGKVSLIEVSRDAEPRFSADAARFLGDPAEQTGRLESQMHPGEPFWASVEIVTNPSVIRATTGIFETSAECCTA